MSWFKSLLGIRTAIKLEDPVFGTLRYERAPRSFWSGETAFPPTKANTYIRIHADERGPTEEQRAFCHSICGRYDSLIGPLSEAVSRTAAEVGMTPRRNFIPESLAMQSIQGEPPEWSFSYGWDDNPDWMLTACLRGWEVVDVDVAH